MEKFDRGEGNRLRNALTIHGIRRNLAVNVYARDGNWGWLVEERTRMVTAEDMKEFSHSCLHPGFLAR